MAHCEWHGNITNHVNTRRLMAALNVKRREAVGIIGCLRAYVIENHPGGVISEDDIPLACEADDINKTQLLDTLANCGWIENYSEREWRLVGWERITKGYRKGKKDAAEARKRRRVTTKKRDECHTDALSTRYEVGTNAQRGEERKGKEEKREEQELPPNPPLGDRRGVGQYGSDVNMAVMALGKFLTPKPETKAKELAELKRLKVPLSDALAFFKAHEDWDFYACVNALRPNRSPPKAAVDIRVGVAPPSPHATETKEIPL